MNSNEMCVSCMDRADVMVDWWFCEKRLKIRAHVAKMTLQLFTPAALSHSFNVLDLNSQLNPLRE